MPKVYLSPSTQDFNETILGPSEEYYANLIVDDMIPYLKSSGIQYVRNTPQMTAATSIKQSNQGNYDIHLAVHSNASPENLKGKLTGTDVYYDPSRSASKRLADIIVDNFKAIYYDPNNVEALPTDFLGEVLRTKAPGVLVEVAYHDNLRDATFIANNINEIARTLVLSLTEYFGIPFIEPQGIKTGSVVLDGGRLNVRSKPSMSAPVIGSIPNGAKVLISGQFDNWYVVNYNGLVGYASADFIEV